VLKAGRRWFWPSARLRYRRLKRSWPLVAGVVLGGWGTLVGGCGTAGEQRGEGRRAASQPAAAIATEVVRPETVALRIPMVGTLHAAEEATISTKAAGVLRRTFVDVGQEVVPGDPLTQVDTVDYDVAVRQAQAALAAALARLGVGEVPGPGFKTDDVSTVQRAAARLASARFTHDRLAGLAAGGLSPVSGQEMNDAETALQVAEADHRLALDEAAALVAEARERQSQLQMAEQRLADATTVTPPIPTTLGREGATEWVVSARLVTEGQYVRAGDPLYRLLIRDPLKLRSKIPERYSADVRIGQTVRLRVVGSIAAPRGRVVRVSPAVEPASRSFEIEALVDNPDAALRPGSFATGVLEAETAGPILMVPGAAIVRTGGVASVFVVEDGVATPRDVTTGRTSGERVEISSGLQAGEEVVVRGAEALADGAPVSMPRAGRD
jgi:RND family efflux transporter MFP subunit